MEDERRTPLIQPGCRNRHTHLQKRRDNPVHGPLPQARRTIQHCGNTGSGQRASQLPHRGGGIAAIQRFNRRLQRLPATAKHCQTVARHRHRHTHLQKRPDHHSRDA